MQNNDNDPGAYIDEEHLEDPDASQPDIIPTTSSSNVFLPVEFHDGHEINSEESSNAQIISVERINSEQPMSEPRSI